MKRVLVAVAVLVALAGCAPEAGTVKDKRVDIGCFGTPAVCHSDPELWVSNPGQHSWPYTDRPAAGWVKVSTRTYELCRIGSEYPACADGAR